MYSMSNIVNNTVLHNGKLLRVKLKSFHTHKNKFVTVVMDVNQTYCGAHFALHTNIKLKKKKEP